MSITLETPKFRPRDFVRYRGYRQAAIGWLVNGVSVGAVYFTIGPLFAAMIPDTGWSLALVSAALLIRGFVAIVFAPMAGWLIRAFGLRVVVVTGSVLTAICFAATGLVTNPIVFCIVFGIGLSFADALIGYVPASTIMSRWFLARRGAVMGVVSSGAGIGGFIFAPLMALLVAGLGWRGALFVLGALVLVLCVPSVFLKNGPRDVGQWVDGVEGRVIPEQGEADAVGTVQKSVKQIARSPLFWAVFSIYGIQAWALAVYSADQVLYLTTIGTNAVQASTALGISGGVAALSGILFARLNDRISPYYVLIAATVLMSIASVVFIFASSLFAVYAYSILFGAGYGILLPTVAVAIGRYFGSLDISRAVGLGLGFVSLMAGIGPFLTGLVSDATGSFTIPIYVVAGLLILSVLIAIVARPPREALAAVETVDAAEVHERQPPLT
ncbi:MAG: major facilitator superfamily transporter [Subtercola sp.]|nr:major facilitator superfamily transporter [Subtercola sp.]